MTTFLNIQASISQKELSRESLLVIAASTINLVTFSAEEILCFSVFLQPIISIQTEQITVVGVTFIKSGIKYIQ
jgi:hypothetical protein